MENKPPIKEKYIAVDEMLQLWNEYKQNVLDNPDEQEEVTARGVMTKKVKRPFQRKGFEAFVFNKLGCHVKQYIDNLNGSYEAYLGVVTHMRNEWEEDQIDGTLTGRYKAPNLVARLNGLTEKVEQTNIEQPLFPDK